MTKDYKRIVYNVLEYNPLLDSSNMTTDDWVKIGTNIEVFAAGLKSSFDF